MTIVDKIKASNLLDSDNDIRVDEAIYKKISKKLIISFVLKHAVKLNEYKELRNKINEILNETKNITYSYNIGYEDESLTNEELKEY